MTRKIISAIILTILVSYFASGGSAVAAETRVRIEQLNALRPRPQNPPNNTIYIEPGIVSVANNEKIEYPGGNSPAFAVVTAYSRIDIVTINSSGTIGVTAGTQAESPAPPTYPTDKIVIAEVTVDETGTVVINDADIKDVRPFLNLGGGGGTIQTTWTIDLIPEFPTAVLSGSGNGVMIAKFDSTANAFQNYYKWKGNLDNQSYDVVVRVLLPEDFGSWDSSEAISFNSKVDDATGNTGVTLTVYDTNDNQDAGYTPTKIKATTWTPTNIGSGSLSGTYNDIDYITLKFTMTADTNDNAMLGEVKLKYTRE